MILFVCIWIFVAISIRILQNIGFRNIQNSLNDYKVIQGH